MTSSVPLVDILLDRLDARGNRVLARSTAGELHELLEAARAATPAEGLEIYCSRRKR